jgi:hypothetical protein
MVIRANDSTLGGAYLRGMTRRKLWSLRRIALGIAVAALVSPAAASARPMDVDGIDARTIHELSQPVRGAEDLAFSRRPVQQQPAPEPKADEAGGYEAGVGSLVGLVLILAASGTAVVVQRRKARLSPA